MEDIMTALKSTNTEFAKTTHEALSKMSPTALKVIELI
jgi:hypothetical protein